MPIAFQSDMSRYCEDTPKLQRPTYSDEVTSRTRQIMGRGYQKKQKKNKEEKGYHLIMHISSRRVILDIQVKISDKPQGRRVPNRTYLSLPENDLNHQVIPSHKLNNPLKHTFKMPNSKKQMIP